MTDKTIDLDRHRGMAAQKATDLRRCVGEFANLQIAFDIAANSPTLFLGLTT